VREWTIEIRSGRDAVETDEAVADLQEALIAGGVALAPTCSQNIPTRRVSATSQVVAPSLDVAAQIGCDASARR
jgi:hypothetical protein